MILRITLVLCVVAIGSVNCFFCTNDIITGKNIRRPSSQSSLTNLKMVSRPVTPYFSYKTFKKLSVPAILYSIAAKITTKIKRVKSKEIIPSSTIVSNDAIDLNTSENDKSKVALITGSNTGVGFETAKKLVIDHGYEVIIACRSEEKGKAACAAINQAALHAAETTKTTNDLKGKAVFLQSVDLSNLESVKDFSQAVDQTYNSIDVLVNNAGRNSVGPPTQAVGGKKLDEIFTTNFLGHFLLTNILLSKCKRIVNLSSVMHHFPIYSKTDEITDIDSIDFWRNNAIEPDQSESDVESNSHRKSYAPSKLAALLFTMELNRRYGKSDGIRSIAVNPGSVNSGIWRNYPGYMRSIFRQIYLTPEQGCTTSVAASVMDFDDDVIYLQPYWLPNRSDLNQAKKTSSEIMSTPLLSCPFPMFEMLGPYVGYQPTQPRLPEDTGKKASESLFTVCEKLAGCKYIDIVAPTSKKAF